MAEVTEAAIKSAKFYKHVVQSVEKFIQKVSEYFAFWFCSCLLMLSLWSDSHTRHDQLAPDSVKIADIMWLYVTVMAPDTTIPRKGRYLYRVSQLYNDTRNDILLLGCLLGC